MEPQRILLCWNYERASWVRQFENIFTNVEYCYLNFFSREQEISRATDAPVYYWEDFKDIDDLLEKLNPGKVIFMGLEGPYNLLLNYVCRKKGIATFYLQHGIFHSMAAYIYEENAMKSLGFTKAPPVARAGNKKQFLKRSFKLSRLPIYLKIIYFLVYKRRSGSIQRALQFIAGDTTQTDHYIVFTKHLSKIFVERDKVPASKFIEIGNEEASRIVNTIRSDSSYDFDKGDHILFIDEAFAGSEEQALPPIIDPEAFNEFLFRLAEFAGTIKKKLLVKLHPFSYNSKHFKVHENLEYIKDANTTELIATSYAVVGFSSTLLIPALFVKRCCLFRLNEHSHLHALLLKLDYCKVIDFQSFSPANIKFNDPETVKNKREELIHELLYTLDGDYYSRLKNALQIN